MGKLSAGRARPLQLRRMHLRQGTSSIVANIHHRDRQGMASKDRQNLHLTWLSRLVQEGRLIPSYKDQTLATSDLVIDVKARFHDV
jgi:hypothetical protein